MRQLAHPEQQRIVARQMRQFVHRAVVEEPVLRRPDRAPEADRHPARGAMPGDTVIRKPIGLFAGALHDGCIGTHGGKAQPPGHQFDDRGRSRGKIEMIDQPVLKAGADPGHGGGAIHVLSGVLLAAPQ